MVYLNKSRAVMTGMLLSLLCVGFFADVNARIQVYKHLESENKSSSRLDLIAYNYTDKYIGNYSVNGIWGGNVMLSSSTSGGSGSGCCFMLSKRPTESVRILVRWQLGGCTYFTKSSASNFMYRNIYYYYKERIVPVKIKEGVKPQYLAVHFYPDGSIQANVTDDLDLPRIVLPEDRPEKSEFPECTRGEHND